MLQSLMGGIVGKAIGGATDIIDQFVEDKDQAAKLKAELQARLQDSIDSEIQAKSAIIQAEATGESWLQRNWRPVLMLVIVAIVANNYLLAPYIAALFGPEAALSLDLPERLWDLMTLGVGGYIAGRSGEKMIERWKGK